MDVSVVTLFCTQEHGLLLQDCYPKPAGLQALLSLDVPYYYFTCKVRMENTVLDEYLLFSGVISYIAHGDSPHKVMNWLFQIFF